jgi:hypothetical protein
MKGMVMKSIKGISFQLIFAVLISLPLTLYAQNNDQEKNKDQKDQRESQQTQNMDQSQNLDQFDDYKNEQLNAELAKLDEEPGDDLEREFQSIAENHARDLQSKLNLDDDAYDDIKEVIIDYLDNRWEARIELAQERNDQEELRENAADLAHLRVELIDEITDELDDQANNQWSNHAVDFWLSLDKAVFDLKMQKTGMAADNMNQDQRN